MRQRSLAHKLVGQIPRDAQQMRSLKHGKNESTIDALLHADTSCVSCFVSILELSPSVHVHLSDGPYARHAGSNGP